MIQLVLLIVILLPVIYWLPKPLIFRVMDRAGILSRAKTYFPKIILTIHSPGSNFPDILNVLREHGAKATFFITGNQVKRYNRELLVLALQQGHHLGNHGMTGRVHARLPYSELDKEIGLCQKILNDAYRKAGIEQRNRLYRPGCGIWNGRMSSIAEEHGCKLVLGSVYPHDLHVRIPLLNFWYLTKHVERGDIIVLHDLPETPQLLRMFLDWAKENGYMVTSLESVDMRR